MKSENVFRYILILLNALILGLNLISIIIKGEVLFITQFIGLFVQPLSIFSLIISKNITNTFLYYFIILSNLLPLALCLLLVFSQSDFLVPLFVFVFNIVFHAKFVGTKLKKKYTAKVYYYIGLFLSLVVFLPSLAFFILNFNTECIQKTCAIETIENTIGLGLISLFSLATIIYYLTIGKPNFKTAKNNFLQHIYGITNIVFLSIFVISSFALTFEEYRKQFLPENEYYNYKDCQCKDRRVTCIAEICEEKVKREIDDNRESILKLGPIGLAISILAITTNNLYIKKRINK